MSDKYAVLLDGGFVIKKLQRALRRFPEAEDVDAACRRLCAHTLLADSSLLRIYFYHAPPATEKPINPISRERLDLSKRVFTK